MTVLFYGELSQLYHVVIYIRPARTEPRLRPQLRGLVPTQGGCDGYEQLLMDADTPFREKLPFA